MLLATSTFCSSSTNIQLSSCACEFAGVAATCASTCTLTRWRGPALLAISGAACHGLGGDMPGAWHLGMVLLGVPVEHAMRFGSLLDLLSRVLSLEACSRGSWGGFGDILLD